MHNFSTVSTTEASKEILRNPGLTSGNNAICSSERPSNKSASKTSILLLTSAILFCAYLSRSEILNANFPNSFYLSLLNNNPFAVNCYNCYFINFFYSSVKI